MDGLDQNSNIVLLAVFPALFRIGIWLPIAEVADYTLDHNLRTERNDLGKDEGPLVLDFVRWEGGVLLD